MPKTSAREYLTQGGLVVKNYHRFILWVILACLFALDIVTTTVSLQQGGVEQNPLMIPFADNPLLHGMVKIAVFILLFLVIEKAVSFIREKRPGTRPFWINVSYRALYGMIIFLMLYLVWLYSCVVLYNIGEIT